MEKTKEILLRDVKIPGPGPSKSRYILSSLTGRQTSAAGRKDEQTEEKNFGAPRFSDLTVEDIQKLNSNAESQPVKYPHNTVYLRYVLAERDPLVVPTYDKFDCRIAFPPSGYLYRPVIPERVELSLQDSAEQLTIHKNHLTVTGQKGYSTARATHFVNRGRWYFEVTVLDMPEGAAARIGWGQQYSNLQAPVGFDRFGYCWRSRMGTRFHAGHGKTYGQSYKAGDVLGFFIELPASKKVSYLLDSYKDKFLIRYGGHFFYEIEQCSNENASALTILPGSTIEFFKNGYSEGVAFAEIYSGAYLPCISLFNKAEVTVNFGPDFHYPNVLEDYEARAFCERGVELVIEQYYSNLLNLIEACDQVPTLKVNDLP